MEASKKPIVFLAFSSVGAPHPYMAAAWLTSKGWPLLFISDGSTAAKEFVTPISTISVDYVQAPGRIGKHFGFLCKLLKLRFTGPKKIFYVQGSSCCLSAWIALLGMQRERVIYETLDFLEPGRHKFWEFFERRFARRAGYVLSNEPCRARFIGSHYQLRDTVRVERTALPAAWPIPERKESLRVEVLKKIGRENDKNMRLIVAGGAFNPMRVGKELLQALKMLPDNYVLVFSGTKPGSATEKQTIESVKAAGVENRAVMLGFLSFEELLEQFAAGDIGILLYPNDDVGSFFQAPGRLTQYTGCGLPFVTSNFPGLELLTLKHNLGAACDPTSPSSIAAAIQSIGGKSDEELAAWRKQLRQVAKRELSYDELAVRIEETVAEAAKFV